MRRSIQAILLFLRIINVKDGYFYGYKINWANPLSWIFLCGCLVFDIIKGVVLGVFEFIMEVEKLSKDEIKQKSFLHK